MALELTADAFNASKETFSARSYSSHMPPNVTSTAGATASVIILALLGIYTVLFLPLEP